ncbi:non-ribosomal peptide synthetase, partial [Amycolatopsis rhizosphaerae]
PPEGEIETRLAEIWQHVLHTTPIGRHDNFFTLGGDSILSLQVVARMRAAGWTLTPKQVFERQTVRELAEAAVPAEAERTAAEQGVVTGPVPLTPILAAFAEMPLPAPHHYNQSALLKAREPIDVAALEDALRRLVHHHDALRLRLSTDGQGARLDQAGTEGLPDRILRVESLRGIPPEEQSAALETLAAQAQASIDLGGGLLLGAVWFDLGDDRPGRLLLVIHHLAVDGVSWRILLEDLEHAYRRFASGKQAGLPAKTTAFRDWARALAEFAGSDEIAAERDYWLETQRAVGPAVPFDFPGGEAANLVSSTASVRVDFSTDETRALLQDVPPVYRTQINDALLSALAQALAPWLGTRRVAIELEGHGREDVPSDVDVTRTVGWFTTLYPVVLDLGADDDQGAMLKRVKEQLRAVPRRGLGYGLLRHHAGDPELRAAPRPAVVFNYLGQFDQGGDGAGLWESAPEDAGPMHDPREPREHPLSITAVIGRGRLEVTWSYSTGLHRRETVAALAERFACRLRDLIAHCREPQAGGRTPADFPLAGLDQSTLDRLLGGDRGIEDVYPLSPMQEGMLFHALYAPGTGVYVEQLSSELAGPLDEPALRAAWQLVIDRHPVLRTSFHWNGLASPVQVVHHGVTPSWERRDWRGLSTEEQRAELARLMREDRARGFDLERAPLLRFHLIRLGDALHRFVFTNHHLLLDGWSFQQVLSEFLTAYTALRQGRPAELPPARPFREYIAWLRRQDEAGAETFWRELLAGYTAPLRLAIDEPEEGPDDAESSTFHQIVLGEEESTALRELAQRHRITLNTLVQSAWAVLLSRYSGADDVVFGMTVAGRPVDLPDAETTVGMFINTLPVRLGVPSRAPVGEWLRQVQERLAELRQFEYTSLVKIQGWTGVPRDTPLFESVVVFENYPEAKGEDRPAELTVQAAASVDRTNFPLTLVAVPGRMLSLQLAYDTRLFRADTVRRMAEQYRIVLE